MVALINGKVRNMEITARWRLISWNWEILMSLALLAKSANILKASLGLGKAGWLLKFFMKRWPCNQGPNLPSIFWHFYASAQFFCCRFGVIYEAKFENCRLNEPKKITPKPKNYGSIGPKFSYDVFRFFSSFAFETFFIWVFDSYQKHWSHVNSVSYLGQKKDLQPKR